MSRLPFELVLALRYLRPKRTFVSVITLISVLGVTLGVAVLIIVISVMSGFDQQLRDRILGFNPHLRVTKDEAMENYVSTMQVLAGNPHIQTISPYVLGPVLLKTQPQTGRPKPAAPYLRGMDPELEATASVMRTNIEGKFDLSDSGLLIGREFARMMHLSVGDCVLIYSPDELQRMEQKRGEQVVLPDEYEVRGIFDVGYYEYNASIIVTSLEEAQRLQGISDSVHGLLVTLKNPNQAPAVAAEVARTLGPEYTVSTWMDENSSLLGALVVEKNVMFYLLFFIMIVAALCILSALITFVVQKTREIGMLKALGATDLQVSCLFLSQSGFVGVTGVLTGLGLGMLSLHYRNAFLHFMNRAVGFELFPARIYGFSELPALIVPHDIALICGSAIFICLLGGVIPAWRAGRLQPIHALRHE